MTPHFSRQRGTGGHNLGGIIHISHIALMTPYTNVNALSLSWRVAHHAVNYFNNNGVLYIFKRLTLR